MMSREKLDRLNASPSDEYRGVSDCLAPFDASGTAVGNGGSELIITTLEFVLRSELHLTSLLVG